MAKAIIAIRKEGDYMSFELYEQALSIIFGNRLGMSIKIKNEPAASGSKV